jgi:hypothetical protein
MKTRKKNAVLVCLLPSLEPETCRTSVMRLTVVQKTCTVTVTHCAGALRNLLSEGRNVFVCWLTRYDVQNEA